MRPPQLPSQTFGDIQAVTRMIAECKNRPLSIRLQTVLLRMLGKSVTETATLLGIHRDSVHSWIRRWNQGGLATLTTIPGQGRPRVLNEGDRKWILRQFKDVDDNGVPFTAVTIYSELKKNRNGRVFDCLPLLS